VPDPYTLDRFVEAQDDGHTYARVVGELRRGRKTSHWMWFVFPQIAGLGSSQISKRFAIASLGEARAYLGHAVLGPRLIECTGLVATSKAESAGQIFGSIDAQKLHSSMTLFLLAAPDQPLFEAVLARYFKGRLDPATEDRV
jgi:uncharacterized protein (DUF1810 family)